jgi:hypothetical protein
MDDLSARFMAVASQSGAKTVQRFVVKLQFKAPPASAAPAAHGSLGTIATAFLSKLKQTHADDVSFVSLADDTFIDLQAMPTKTDDDCRSLFKVVHRPNAYRASKLWIKLETSLTYSAVKKPIFDYLRSNDYGLDLHGFGIQVTKVMRIGYLLDLDPRHIFRDDLQASINQELSAQLTKLVPDARTALFQKFKCSETNADRTPPKIRLLFVNKLQHLADTRSVPVHTRALALECPFEDRNLVEFFLMKFSRHVSGYFGKFINATMTKQSPFVPQFRTLVASHNKLLSQHRAIPIAGITTSQMDAEDDSGSTLRDFLLDLDHVLRVERTPASPSLGKWLIFTTATHQAACKIDLDHHLAEIFRAMDLAPGFPRFPEPRRLPTIAPPVDYIAAIMADADLNLGADACVDDHATLDNTNAWHKGPPKTSSDSSHDSTMTRTAAHTVLLI